MADDNVIDFPGDGNGPAQGAESAVPADLLAQFRAMGVSDAEILAVVKEALSLGGAYGLGGPGGFDEFGDTRPQPMLLPRRAEPASYRLRVDLDGAKPPIWRRIVVPSDLTLDRLHMLLQPVMGWTDTHLHSFYARGDRRGTAPFLSPYDVSEGEEGIVESDVRLDEVLGAVGDKLGYDYDFGDDWRHTLRLEEIRPAGELGCLTGRRACPPENCGGLPGYEEILDALAGKPLTAGFFHNVEQLRGWLPPAWEPDAFDVDLADQAVKLIASPTFGTPPPLTELNPTLADLLARPDSPAAEELGFLTAGALAAAQVDERSVAEITAPLAALLDAVGDGVQLTTAGYLPPRVVEQVFTTCDMGRDWIGAGNREDLTPPVAHARHAAQSVGLLRRQGRSLTPTAAAKAVRGEPAALWRHVASRLVAGRPDQREAGAVLLLAVAGGELPRDFASRVTGLLDGLGWREGLGTTDDFWTSAGPTWELLVELRCVHPSGLITDPGMDLAAAALWPGRTPQN